MLKFCDGFAIYLRYTDIFTIFLRYTDNFALYLRYHNIFALYPRYFDISRQMWMQNLMKNKDEISKIPKLTTAYQVTKRRFG